MAEIEQVSGSQYEIRVRIINLDTGYSGSDRYYDWYFDGVKANISSYTLPAYASVSAEFWMTYAQIGQAVNVTCRIYYSGGTAYVDLQKTCYVGGGGGSTRPSYFYWTYPKTSGGTFNLTAAEWNSFTANINAVRQYKGLSGYYFTAAVTGQRFTAAMYNEAVYAIQGVPGYGYYISTHSAGDVIYASYLNTAVSELNSIP